MGRRPYDYRAKAKKEAAKQLKAIALKGDRETELDWMSRMRNYGFTDERIALFQTIRSKDDFVTYCTELNTHTKIGISSL